MNRLLAWCAGVDSRMVGSSTVERARYFSTGLALVMTALLALGTATLMLRQITGHWSLLFVPVAVVWAIIVFNVDRLLVTSFDYGPLDRSKNDLDTPPKRARSRYVGFAGRILLAAVIAYSVADPAMLVLFNSEIRQQLDVDKSRSAVTAEDEVRAQFDDQRRAVDATLAGAQKASDAAGVSAAQARDQFDAEVNGTGGTQVQGCDPRPDSACEVKRRAWQEAQDAADSRSRELVVARTDHDRAIAALESRIRDAVADRGQAITDNNGFLASAKALDEVVAANPALQARRLLIAGLLFLVDLLPVLIKLFGPTTLVERQIRRDAIGRDEDHAAHDRIDQAGRASRLSFELAGVQADHERKMLELRLSRDIGMKEIYQRHLEELEQLHERYARTSVLDPDPLDTVVLPWPMQGRTEAITGPDPSPPPGPAPGPGPRPDGPRTGDLVLKDRWWVSAETPPGSESGGMGETRIAVDLMTPDRRVVVKRVRRTADHDDAAAQRLAMQFEKELRRHSLVRSEHVAPVVDTGNDTAFGTFIVTDLYPGTIARRLADARRGGFAPDLQWALRMGRQTLQGLVDCWELAMVHLDIKPANLALDDDGRVRLIDFGLAKVAPSGDLASTGVGFTWFYAPYEQMVQKPATRWCTSRCDVRATGATLYEVLTGRPPLWREAQSAGLLDVGGSPRMDRIKDLVDLVQSGRPAPPSTLPFLAGLPSEVDDLVGYMLEPRPEDRPRDVRVALEQLVRVVDTVAGTDQEYRPVGWAACTADDLGEGA